jgi:hypothetical protein
MNIEALGLVVHRAHAVGLEDAMFLGEVGLCERLGWGALAIAQLRVYEAVNACSLTVRQVTKGAGFGKMEGK